MRNTNTDYSVVLLGCIIFIVLALVAGAVFYSFVGSQEIATGDAKDDRVINTLFVVEDNHKLLCSYVLFYYPATKRAAVFNVPGNIGRILKKINRVDRIDAVYDGRHPDAYITEIEDMLAIDINYYVVFGLDDLAKMVDLLDGVTVSIPQPIDIRTDTGKTVLFPSGRTTLDGDKARIYVSYNGDGEIEALHQRQDRFFIALLRKLNEKNDYLKKTEVDALMSRLLQTNMTHRIRTGLFDEFAKIDTDRVTVQTVGGNRREVSGQELLFPFYDSSLVKDIVRQTVVSLTREGAFTATGRVITVEVLNGTNVSGLAARTAELIRVFGYDVIKVGNAEHSDYARTRVVDHINQEEEAENFAGLIRCKDISTDADTLEYENELQNYEYRADFTLIIGRDFNGRWVQG